MCMSRMRGGVTVMAPWEFSAVTPTSVMLAGSGTSVHPVVATLSLRTLSLRSMTSATMVRYRLNGKTSAWIACTAEPRPLPLCAVSIFRSAAWPLMLHLTNPIVADESSGTAIRISLRRKMPLSFVIPINLPGGGVRRSWRVRVRGPWRLFLPVGKNVPGRVGPCRGWLW